MERHVSDACAAGPLHVLFGLCKQRKGRFLPVQALVHNWIHLEI